MPPSEKNPDQADSVDLFVGDILDIFIATYCMLYERKEKYYGEYCRLSVKSLVEKSCFESVTEQCEEVQNFLAIMEHLLSHRMKGKAP